MVPVTRTLEQGEKNESKTNITDNWTIAFTYCLLLLYQQSRDTLSSEEIYALIEQGETEIDLTKLTDLEWTTAGIYGPYTRGKDIKQDMGIASPFSLIGIDVPENRFLLVLVDDGRVVETLYLSREYGDYLMVDERVLVVEELPY